MAKTSVVLLKEGLYSEEEEEDTTQAICDIAIMFGPSRHIDMSSRWRITIKLCTLVYSLSIKSMNSHALPML